MVWFGLATSRKIGEKCNIKYYNSKWGDTTAFHLEWINGHCGKLEII